MLAQQMLPDEAAALVSYANSRAMNANLMVASEGIDRLTSAVASETMATEPMP